MQLEICLDSVESAVRAEQAGAHRIELCANLIEGGTTPSAGTIALCRKRVTGIPIHVMIRPRGGDFCYSDDEYHAMKYDIELCKKLGVEGIVLGLLTPDGQVDVDRTRKLVQVAQPMNVTFHRAFDMTRDPVEALESLIAIGGIQRVLTSGQEASVVEGLDTLRNLVACAGDRIIILPGGGITDRHVERIRRELPELKELHVAVNEPEASSMVFRNHRVFMGFALHSPEYQLSVANSQAIDSILKRLQ